MTVGMPVYCSKNWAMLSLYTGEVQVETGEEVKIQPSAYIYIRTTAYNASVMNL